ncbi:Nucleic-acid-binding protein from transposon X-element [Eumeta japonica]|uniref:Nucleic-acid-binding protein from transposon X-element n=1 Tax=Eumeta variegata TaxID=151549 RepID=A0A4C2A7Y3_EUMVA|nr:Nucleic-acid-binding protein from transposon X-element [Eumeta japonica]
MSSTNSPTVERRLSVNNRNAYIVLTTENINSQQNIADTMVNKQNISAGTTEASTSASSSAPQLGLLNKVQTGMDRYVTITKRKSSPRSPRFEPSSKQPKNTMASQNRFALLDKTEEPTVSTKSFKPPPLYLREATTNELVKRLTQTVGKDNFYVASLKKGNVLETKIQVNTETNYRKLVKSLDLEKKSYYTYQLKSAKGLVVVVKGIDSSVPLADIKDALELEGYEVKSVFNILNKNKVPQPMFKIEIAINYSQMRKKGEVHPIYNLKYLLNRRVVVEEPIKRKGPPQCQNCQEFGHTKTFCKLPSVCVKCGDIHKSLDCPHAKDDARVLKCSNCGGNHTANYRGCEVYLRLKQKPVKKTVYTQYRNNVATSQPPTMQQQNSRVTNANHQPLSYAQTLKNSTAAPANLSNENNPVFNERDVNYQSSMDKLIQKWINLWQICRVCFNKCYKIKTY